jgi:hypothetical protein
MERLTLEQLARLVDEAPTDREREILSRNPALQAELEALREQSRALRNLPSVLPPHGDWAELEARLVDERLIRPGATRSEGRRWWLQAAAGLVLFLGGTATGQAFGGPGTPAVPGAGGGDMAFTSVEEAAQAVEAAERRYLAAVSGYQQVAEQQDGARPTRDPASRFAALEALLAASQAAVRESPADPFFNGVLVNTLMERQQTLRQISGDNWY